MTEFHPDHAKSAYDFKVITKYLLGTCSLFGPMLSMSVLQGAMAYWKIDDIANITNNILNNTIPSISEARGINALIIRTRLWQFRYMTDESDTGKIESKAKTVEFAAERDRTVQRL